MRKKILPIILLIMSILIVAIYGLLKGFPSDNQSMRALDELELPQPGAELSSEDVDRLVERSLAAKRPTNKEWNLLHDLSQVIRWYYINIGVLFFILLLVFRSDTVWSALTGIMGFALIYPVSASAAIAIVLSVALYALVRSARQIGAIKNRTRT